MKKKKTHTGFQIDNTVHSLNVTVGEKATLKVKDIPKVTTTLINIFKIDMETWKSTPQGNATLVWKYYDGYYIKDNLPTEATWTWITRTIAETNNDGSVRYTTRLDESYKVSGDSFYTQNNISCLPLGTITVDEATIIRKSCYNIYYKLFYMEGKSG